MEGAWRPTRSHSWSMKDEDGNQLRIFWTINPYSNWNISSEDLWLSVQIQGNVQRQFYFNLLVANSNSSFYGGWSLSQSLSHSLTSHFKTCMCQLLVHAYLQLKVSRPCFCFVFLHFDQIFLNHLNNFFLVITMIFLLSSYQTNSYLNICLEEQKTPRRR